MKDYNELETILFSEAEIDQKVRLLADMIHEDYEDTTDPLILIGILKGSVMFLTDLARRIRLPLQLDFMSVSSYGAETTSSGDVRILKDLDHTVEGAHAIIVEDIIDSGYTLAYVKKTLEARGAKSIKIATLLNKPERRKVEVPIDYLGFDIPDEFVVGYGIDWAEKYRNLPFIATVSRSAYEKE